MSNTKKARPSKIDPGPALDRKREKLRRKLEQEYNRQRKAGVRKLTEELEARIRAAAE